MDLKELITKTEVQRSTILELIQKAETKEECFTELAVERFLKGFLTDLKAMAKKPNASENTLPIQSVTNCYSMNETEAVSFREIGAKSIKFTHGGGIGIKVECLNDKGKWLDITDYSCW